MKRTLLLLLLITAFVGCDYYDKRLKTVNQYKDDILINRGFSEIHIQGNLKIFKERWDGTGCNIVTSYLFDTISHGVLGSWKNVFSSPDDTLLIFVVERSKMYEFFEDKIEVDSVYETFVFTYRELLENNWVITLTPQSRRLVKPK